MEKIVKGKVFVAGDNIDTDQIIPAKFLSYNPADNDERKFFGRYAMAGVPDKESGLPQGNVKFTPEDEFKSQYVVIVAGKNFGCGSSREHAPLAIAEAGCHIIVAESYARIFFRNCVNGGYCAPMVTGVPIYREFVTGQDVQVDLDKGELKNLATGKTYKLEPLGDVADIVAVGGVFEYARKTGMLQS
ncbi:MAG TPA: 3-isopropylmalate dehydratase [Phycisphaerae bacterium]|nr:3-isopropylmalate dehydratase [Phycisphaerae bacterium]